MRLRGSTGGFVRRIRKLLALKPCKKLLNPEPERNTLKPQTVTTGKPKLDTVRSNRALKPQRTSTEQDFFCNPLI